MNWPACQAQGSSGCRHLVPRERAPGARSLEPSSLWIGYGGAERKSQEPGAEPIHTPQYPKNLEPRTSNPRTSNPTSTFHLEPHLDLPPSLPPSTFHQLPLAGLPPLYSRLPPTSAVLPLASAEGEARRRRHLSGTLRASRAALAAGRRRRGGMGGGRRWRGREEVEGRGCADGRRWMGRGDADDGRRGLMGQMGGEGGDADAQSAAPCSAGPIQGKIRQTPHTPRPTFASGGGPTGSRQPSRSLLLKPGRPAAGRPS